jgi:peptide/nickel transport system ATP-binding protein
MARTLEEAGEVPADVTEALGIRREWMRRYPHELSGGELQRFCVARAVVARPRYLVADEMSTMLDALTQAQLWEFVLDWQRRTGAGIVFVSNSPALTERLATRIVDL